MKYASILLIPVIVLAISGCSSQSDSIDRWMAQHPPMRIADASGSTGPALQNPPGATPPSPIQPLPPAPPMHVKGKVVIDAGHGGKDPGTHTASGVTEKSITLAVALAAAKSLREKGVEVILTRSDDTFIELADRTAIANRSGAQLFVSIHADATKNSSIQGHTILLPQDNAQEANRLATLISRNMVKDGSALHTLRDDDRGLYVLKHTHCTSVLVELGFLSNKKDAAELTKAANQASLGKAIADGIAEYLQGVNP